jgi:uncharacterized membrane protein YjgN (DUF898 family)
MRRCRRSGWTVEFYLAGAFLAVLAVMAIGYVLVFQTSLVNFAGGQESDAAADGHFERERSNGIRVQ